MSEGEILAVPSQMLETAPVYTSKASSVTTFGSEIDSATTSLLSTLEGSGLPLGSFIEATATLIQKTDVSFQCAEKNLEGMAQALVTAAHEYSSTDAQLAALFSALEAVIPDFAGYEPPGSLMPGQKPPAEVSPHQTPQPQHHSGWGWGSLWHDVSSPLATAWNDTGGKAVSFVGQQAGNIGAGLAGLGASAFLSLRRLEQNPDEIWQEIEKAFKEPAPKDQPWWEKLLDGDPADGGGDVPVGPPMG